MKSLNQIFAGLALLTSFATPAFADGKYACSFEHGDVQFTLQLKTVYSRIEPYKSRLAKVTSNQTGASSSGHFFSHVIGGQVRLTGYTSYNIQTAGALGKVNLSLIGKEGTQLGEGKSLFGHGTIDGETIIGDCKKK